MIIKRLTERLKGNSKRVIFLPFVMDEDRTKKIINRVAGLPDSVAESLLAEVVRDFVNRHSDLDGKLLRNFKKIEYLVNEQITPVKKYLIGAYFSKEYSVEAAALFNPSIVLHPDQSGLKPGSARIILSLRATGEGHISSIEFRTGEIDKELKIKLDPSGTICELPEIDSKKFTADEIKKKICGLNAAGTKLLESLPRNFTKEEFELIVKNYDYQDDKGVGDIIDYIDANYNLLFSLSSELNERVIFPYSGSERMGMEDLRLVKFKDEKNRIKYYGTYTAYNGSSFRVQMIETMDFSEFKVKTLHGAAVKDKGMALFPRKINGKYYMTGRQGGEELSIMESDDLYRWDNYRTLKSPEYDWEFVQLGNCGSPIETEFGWLLITHAVGFFRKYVISACLLDLENPAKVIGTLKSPLLSPNENEREGYVPNALYSCGSIVHNDNLIIPYAMSDSCTGFARVSVSELIDKME